MLILIVLRNVKKNVGFREFGGAELYAKHLANFFTVNLGYKNELLHSLW